MATSTRERIDTYLDDDVPANDKEITNLPDIPIGEVWTLERFGGSSFLSSNIRLLVRTGVGPNVWEAIRQYSGPGGQQYDIMRSWTGDGVVKFRIVRDNKESTPRPIFAWLEGYKQ